MYFLPSPSVPAEQTPDLPFQDIPMVLPRHHHYTGVAFSTLCFQNVKGRTVSAAPALDGAEACLVMKVTTLYTEGVTADDASVWLVQM